MFTPISSSTFRLVCLFIHFTTLCSSKPSAPIIDLGYAQYQGVFDKGANVTDFLGIRFAAAPIGDLRWQAPQPPETVSEVQVADTLPPSCFISDNGLAPLNPIPTNAKRSPTNVTSPTEDCLFVSVYVPGDTIPTAASLPVVVWIHGGGYTRGNGSQYTAQDLLQESNNGVVAVVIQYRLGIFGFLAGNEVKKNGALNAGLLDQHFALRWVNQHISKFGGDRNSVTIWGQSAGAGSVIQHIVAENGQTEPPLFRAGITSSTFLPPQYAYNDTIPEALFKEVVERANCTSTSNPLACLRNVDAAALQAINVELNTDGFFGTFTTVPVIDGTFITQSPTEALRQGKVNGEALLSVVNTLEGHAYVNQNTTLNASFYASQLFPGLGPDQASRVATLYAKIGTAADRNTQIMTEAIFVCPTYFLLEAFPGRSFKGQFAIPPAFHANDIPYYFPTFGKNGNMTIFNNTDFIDAFSQAFLSFAISLDPNVKVNPTITPQWNVYSDGNNEMRFNKTAEDLPDIESVITDPALLERCRFWQSVAELTGQ